jgi:LAS superfamily LD-carboxypeptidase LdcB
MNWKKIAGIACDAILSELRVLLQQRQQAPSMLDVNLKEMPGAMPAKPIPVSSVGGTQYLTGLKPETYQLAIDMIAQARSLGLSFNFISGLRSAEQQAKMQAQWDSGDHSGLAVRPATDSAHITGEAFDIAADSDTLRVLGQWAIARGARWGGIFVPSDPGHFDTRGN